MDRCERVARIIAKELTGYSPDILVMTGEPERVRGGFVVMNDRWTSPLWSNFVDIASAVLAEMDKTS